MFTWGGYARACALIAAAAIVGTASPAAGRDGSDTAALDAGQVSARVRAAVAAAQEHQPIPPDFTPGLDGLSEQKADVGACDYNTSTHRLCRRGDRSSDRTIVVLGDSHARHWIPAVNRAAKRNGYAVYFLVKPSCNASDMQRTRPSAAKRCNAFRDWAYGQARRLHPEVVVIAGQVPESARVASGVIVHGQQRLIRMYERGLVHRIRSLGRAVGHVVVIGDAPGLGDRPGHCLRVAGNDLGDCAFTPNTRDRKEIRAAHRAAVTSGSGFLDPRPWFCADRVCPTLIDGIVTYRDLEHVTPTYAGTLAGVMAAGLGLTAGRG